MTKVRIRNGEMLQRARKLGFSDLLPFANIPGKLLSVSNMSSYQLGFALTHEP